MPEKAGCVSIKKAFEFLSQCPETKGCTEKQKSKGQINKQNYTDFDRNQGMMRNYPSVKSFRVNVQKRTMLTNRQTAEIGRNDTKFDSKLIIIVIYLPIKFNFDYTNCFQVRVQKR